MSAYIRTMAAGITEETYSIAVACLGPGFARIPKSKVLGCLLVINDYVPFTILSDKDGDDYVEAGIKLSNSWMDMSTFDRTYAPLKYDDYKKLLDGTFVEVVIH